QRRNPCDVCGVGRRTTPAAERLSGTAATRASHRTRRTPGPASHERTCPTPRAMASESHRRLDLEPCSDSNRRQGGTMKSTIRSAVILIALLGTPLFSQTITINMGTVAPERSPWHLILLKMKDDWAKASGGKVVLRIYAEGRQGDESQMLRTVRQGST